MGSKLGSNSKTAIEFGEYAKMSMEIARCRMLFCGSSGKARTYNPSVDRSRLCR